MSAYLYSDVGKPNLRTKICVPKLETEKHQLITLDILSAALFCIRLIFNFLTSLHKEMDLLFMDAHEKDSYNFLFSLHLQGVGQKSYLDHLAAYGINRTDLAAE